VLFRSHRALAFEFTQLAHGENTAQAVRTASEILFGSEVREISRDVFDQLAGEVPSTRVSRERLKGGVLLTDILLETKLVKSKRAARDLIGQGGAYVNNVAWRDVEARVDLKHVLSGRTVLLRTGKKNYHLLTVY
jgi:tyrosyl-tRNA synthetase